MGRRSWTFEEAEHFYKYFSTVKYKDSSKHNHNAISTPKKKKISNYLVSTNSQSVFKFPSYLRGWLVGLMLKQDSCLALQPALLHDKGTFRLELQVFSGVISFHPRCPHLRGAVQCQASGSHCVWRWCSRGSGRK